MVRSYSIRTLSIEDMSAMYVAFLEAFSDYKVSFKMDKPTFDRRFLNKLNISFDLSVGVFHESKLVGFIFHAVNYYQGIKVLYNGGTGVLIEHRGKKLVQEMYQFILPIAKNFDIRSSVLEVLTDNEKAIKAYQNVGFQKRNTFLCFKSTGLQFHHVNEEVSIVKPRTFDPEKYKYFNHATPSFQDTNEHLANNASYETILEARLSKEIVGYIIFQKSSGRISQLAVKKEFQFKGIGTKLLLSCSQLIGLNKSMTLINLSAEDHITCQFLLNRGFENQINQYEMTLSF